MILLLSDVELVGEVEMWKWQVCWERLSDSGDGVEFWCRIGEIGADGKISGFDDALVEEDGEFWVGGEESCLEMVER